MSFRFKDPGSEGKHLFVPLMMGITLASNLAVGYIVGIAFAYALE